MVYQIEQLVLKLVKDPSLQKFSYHTKEYADFPNLLPFFQNSSQNMEISILCQIAFLQQHQRKYQFPLLPQL